MNQELDDLLQPLATPTGGADAQRRSLPPAGVDGRFARAMAWLDATPAEMVGLSVLLAGAVAITALTFFSASQRPDLPAWLPPADTQAPSDDGALEGPLESRQAPVNGAASESLLIHVSGAVATPGVVKVAAGARVADAITQAGGPNGDAALEQLNLARQVADGEHVHVPRHGDEPDANPDVEGPPGGVAHDGRININRASPAQLQSLPGIGPAKAQAIVEYRQEEGPFRVPGDLRGVPGIGEGIFQRIAELIVIG